MIGAVRWPGSQMIRLRMMNSMTAWSYPYFSSFAPVTCEQLRTVHNALIFGLAKPMPDLRKQPDRAIIKTVGLTWHNPNSLTLEGCEIRVKPVASGRSSSTPVSRLKRLPGRESSASGQKLAEDRQQDVALGVGGIQRRHHAPQLSLGGPRCQARRQSTKSRLDGGNVRDFRGVEVSDPGPNGPARGNASRLTPAWA